METEAEVEEETTIDDEPVAAVAVTFENDEDEQHDEEPLEIVPEPEIAEPVETNENEIITPETEPLEPEVDTVEPELAQLDDNSSHEMIEQGKSSFSFLNFKTKVEKKKKRRRRRWPK